LQVCDLNFSSFGINELGSLLTVKTLDMKTHLLLSAFILFCFAASAQPINDNCPTAVTLTVPCTTPYNGTVAGATQSDTGATCNTFTSAEARDVWFQFAALSGSTYHIRVAPSVLWDAVVNVRSGTCGNQIPVACQDNNGVGAPELLIFTAPSSGTYFIRVYPFIGSITDTIALPSFTICITIPTGIEEAGKETPLSVFPNPTTGKVSITLDRVMTDASLTVYNALGEKIYSNVISSQGNLNTELSMNEPPGIYFLEVKDKQSRYIKKVLIQADN
jgi:hypothetical protein